MCSLAISANFLFDSMEVNLEDYLGYVRSSPNYQSKFISTKREYSKSHPDGIEISIFKDEI